MTKRFEFREINTHGMVPKIYDTEREKYANLLECCDWLNTLYEENRELRADRNRWREKALELSIVIEEMMKDE